MVMFHFMLSFVDLSYVNEFKENIYYFSKETRLVQTDSCLTI